MRTVAKVLKKSPKGVVLFGKDGIGVGTAVSLYETKVKDTSGKKKILKVIDNISVDVYGGRNLKTSQTEFGLGVDKGFDIKNLFRIGAGIYVTKSTKDMFSKEGWRKAPNISLGLSGSWKF